MKSLKSLMLICAVCFSTTLVAQSLTFESVERESGTAFFAINSSTGQLSFMLDYGDNAGNWKNYGGVIRSSGADNLQFYTLSRTDGTAFFAMDGSNGQLYYMLDYGSSAGDWKSYGGQLTVSNAGYDFQASTRSSGTAFFAMEQGTGQIYYLLDYGSNAGTWNKYGGEVPH